MSGHITVLAFVLFSLVSTSSVSTGQKMSLMLILSLLVVGSPDIIILRHFGRESVSLFVTKIYRIFDDHFAQFSGTDSLPNPYSC
uniref:Putative product n=1 Tax=Xenopsylla cheopis TaxID=163159 RepID=A0A6M2DVK1_XENCH